eukprot:3478631-Alexandrium_andersonii.AAC.1
MVMGRWQGSQDRFRLGPRNSCLALYAFVRAERAYGNENLPRATPQGSSCVVVRAALRVEVVLIMPATVEGQ